MCAEALPLLDARIAAPSRVSAVDASTLASASSGIGATGRRYGHPPPLGSWAELRRRTDGRQGRWDGPRIVRPGGPLGAARPHAPYGPAVPTASSALRVSARALSASFEPLTPRLRSVRWDTRWPAPASSRAMSRACSMPGSAVRGTGGAGSAAAWLSCRGRVLVRLGGRGSLVVRSGGFWSGWFPDWSGGARERLASGWSGVAGLCVPGCCGVLAQHVGQGGPHAQYQNRKAGHEGGYDPGCPGDVVLVHQVERDLPGHAEREGADR
jgi:hypothetical protein